MNVDLGCGFIKRGDVNIDVLRKYKPNVIANIAILPIRDSVADQVTLINSLEHVKNPQRVLMEVSRILKVGGKITVSTPNMFTWKRGYAVDSIYDEHKQKFNFRILKVLLRKAGFKCYIKGYGLGLVNMTFLPKFLYKLLNSLYLIMCDNLNAVGTKKGGGEKRDE